MGKKAKKKERKKIGEFVSFIGILGETPSFKKDTWKFYCLNYPGTCSVLSSGFSFSSLITALSPYYSIQCSYNICSLSRKMQSISWSRQKLTASWRNVQWAGHFNYHDVCGVHYFHLTKQQQTMNLKPSWTFAQMPSECPPKLQPFVHHQFHLSWILNMLTKDETFVQLVDLLWWEAEFLPILIMLPLFTNQSPSRGLQGPSVWHLWPLWTPFKMSSRSFCWPF